LPESSCPWADPRSKPKPSTCTLLVRTTPDPGALTKLHQLCREGRLYDIEDWIRAGHPLQAAQGTTVKGRRLTSALEIALEAGTHALTLLLLCNGYDPNLERDSPLDLALRARRWDLLDLLLDWGADPQRVSLSDLFDTYQSDLFARFSALGVDLTANHELAQALADHPGNKPLFGFAKHRREHDPKFQTELNIALVHHAGQGNEKGVQLCLWAGADPHAPAPSLRYPDDTDEEDGESDPNERFRGFTAIHEACRGGHPGILERLGPDPLRDDFDDLYHAASHGGTLTFLSRYALPKKISAVLHWHLLWLRDFPFGTPRSTDTIRRLFEVGVRWESATPEEIKNIRWMLLRTRDDTFVEVMRLLARDGHCAPEILKALGRTPAMRARMARVGFIRPPVSDPRRFERPSPSGARDVLAKFGVPLPKPRRPLPHTVQIGQGRADTRPITLDRQKLFRRVWNKPVETLAQAWGLSGRGLAEACRRLQIPVPPRGFWAKSQHGQRMRRPPLPELPPGEAEEILIYVNDTVDQGD